MWCPWKAIAMFSEDIQHTRLGWLCDRTHLSLFSVAMTEYLRWGKFIKKTGLSVVLKVRNWAAVSGKGLVLFRLKAEGRGQGVCTAETKHSGGLALEWNRTTIHGWLCPCHPDTSSNCHTEESRIQYRHACEGVHSTYSRTMPFKLHLVVLQEGSKQQNSRWGPFMSEWFWTSLDLTQKNVLVFVPDTPPPPQVS